MLGHPPLDNIYGVGQQIPADCRVGLCAEQLFGEQHLAKYGSCLGQGKGWPEAQKRLAYQEGIFAAPEGAATLAGLEQLVQTGWVQPEEKIVLFNTGTGLKYLRNIV